MSTEIIELTKEFKSVLDKALSHINALENEFTKARDMLFRFEDLRSTSPTEIIPLRLTSPMDLISSISALKLSQRIFTNHIRNLNEFLKENQK